MVASNARKNFGFLHISFYKVVQIVLPIINIPYFKIDIWIIIIENAPIFLLENRGVGRVADRLFPVQNLAEIVLFGI